MELAGVQKLARVLRVMVIVVFVCNIAALFLVPGMVAFYGSRMSLRPPVSISIGYAAVEPAAPLELAAICAARFARAFLEVWKQSYTAVLTLFLWACGVCTAIILWQGKRVLDTILKGETFTFGNAANMKRAAICCFVISGAALVRTIWGLIYYQSFDALLTYNFLFFPLFLLAGLVCMVMSALFRQAAEMKAENDLTI